MREKKRVSLFYDSGMLQKPEGVITRTKQNHVFYMLIINVK